MLYRMLSYHASLLAASTVHLLDFFQDNYMAFVYLVIFA